MQNGTIRDFYDFDIVAGGNLPADAVTLLAILRDEMYFLPKFIEHYRTLGIERFVILNDRSQDGSREFLISQPDVTLVESRRTYADHVQLNGELSKHIKRARILYIWRSLLHEIFAPGRWAVQVDLDEFIRLPRGYAFHDIFSALEGKNFHAVWGAMLDVYPSDLSALAEQERRQHLDLNADWYFDGVQHFRLREGRQPKYLYPGARARLYDTYIPHELFKKYADKPDVNLVRRFSSALFGSQVAQYNLIHKPVLVRWQAGSLFINSHKTTLPTSSEHLLPVQHFRFAGNIYEKIERAIRENSYSFGSRDYILMDIMLNEMSDKGGDFLYKKSVPLADYEICMQTRNSIGF